MQRFQKAIAFPRDVATELDQPIGIEQERGVRLESNLVRWKGHVAQHADRNPAAGKPSRAGQRGDRRRWMSGGRVGKRATRSVDDAEDGRYDGLALVQPEGRVDA